MSLRDAMREFNEKSEPVLAAIDTAIRAGVDPESLSEAIESHLEWWRDELAAKLAFDEDQS